VSLSHTFFGKSLFVVPQLLIASTNGTSSPKPDTSDPSIAETGHGRPPSGFQCGLGMRDPRVTLSHPLRMAPHLDHGGGGGEPLRRRGRSSPPPPLLQQPSAYRWIKSFGSLVADQWSGSLPFCSDDADVMVVFGTPSPPAGSLTAPSRRSSPSCSRPRTPPPTTPTTALASWSWSRRSP
jgi:hypothetical protein